MSVAPLYPFAIIPAKQIAAAEGFGKLVAMGVVSWEECVEPLLKAAQENGYRGEAVGARILFACRIRDAATAWEFTRDKADQAIRKVMAPMIQSRAPGRAILIAGWQENRRWNEPFNRAEVEAIAREEAAWWVRQNARVLEYA